uniref:Protein F26A3.7 n=1 Tax=Haemonchus contortus TaxID=6289 RepID=W6N9C8_HAECO
MNSNQLPSDHDQDSQLNQNGTPNANPESGTGRSGMLSYRDNNEQLFAAESVSAETVASSERSARAVDDAGSEELESVSSAIPDDWFGDQLFDMKISVRPSGSNDSLNVNSDSDEVRPVIDGVATSRSGETVDLRSNYGGNGVDSAPNSVKLDPTSQSASATSESSTTSHVDYWCNSHKESEYDTSDESSVLEDSKFLQPPLIGDVPSFPESTAEASSTPMDIGPAPPPRQIGPTLPPGFDVPCDEEDIAEEECFGPMPPVPTQGEAGDDNMMVSDEPIGPMPISSEEAERAAEEYALLRMSMMNKEDTNKPKREDWMLKVPEKAANIGLGARTFKRGSSATAEMDKSWEDSPQTKKPCSEGDVVVMKSLAEAKRDEEQRKLAEAFNKDRKESFVDSHLKAGTSSKSQNATAAGERVPFDRERDMGGADGWLCLLCFGVVEYLLNNLVVDGGQCEKG